MPIVLEDEYLVPPSMRRKRYYHADPHERVIEVARADDRDSVASGSTIDLQRSEGPILVQRGPSQPVVIHEDHYIPVNDRELVREHGRPEYVIEAAIPRGGLRYSHDHDRGTEFLYDRRPRRARSVGYESSCSECCSCSETDAYYVEGSHGRRSQRGHHAPEFLAVGGAAADRHRHRPGRRHHSPHRGRHAAGLGTVLVGAHEVRKHRRYSRSRSSSSDRGSHHKLRNAAALAGAAGLGAAAMEARNRRRQRSRSSSSTSDDDSGHHKLRNAALIGVTGLGLKKLHDRRHHEQAEHLHQHPHFEGDERSRRNRRLAEAGFGLAAAGATKSFIDRRRSRSRSRRSSRSPSHKGRHVAAAALGATAAGLAAHKLTHRNRSSSRDSYTSSSSSSDDESKHRHRGRKISAGAMAAGATAAALHHRRRRSRSSSSTSSGSDGERSHHRLGNAALGLAGAEAVRRHHRSRSRSRPGILKNGYHQEGERRKSRSRSRMGRLMMHGAGPIVNGVLQRPRARSMDSGDIQRVGSRRHGHGGGGGGGRNNEGFMGQMAYRVGEAMAEGLQGGVHGASARRR